MIENLFTTKASFSSTTIVIFFFKKLQLFHIKLNKYEQQWALENHQGQYK